MKKVMIIATIFVLLFSASIAETASIQDVINLSIKDIAAGISDSTPENNLNYFLSYWKNDRRTEMIGLFSPQWIKEKTKYLEEFPMEMSDYIPKQIYNIVEMFRNCHEIT